MASVLIPVLLSLPAVGESPCHWRTIELKRAYERQVAARQSFTEAAIKNFSERPLLENIKEWANSSVPRIWITELPIDWDAALKNAERSETGLIETAMLMKLFRDQNLTNHPDVYSIQTDWISWASAQAPIETHDDHPNQIFARRAQIVFDRLFDQKYAKFDNVSTELHMLQGWLEFTSPGAIALAARDLKYFSDSPSDREFAAKATALADSLSKKLIGMRMVLSRVDTILQSERSADRSYVQVKWAHHLRDLRDSVELLIGELTRLDLDLFQRTMEAANVSTEIETPRGQEVWAEILRRHRNAQRSHEIELINAVKANDKNRLLELLSQNLVPASSVIDSEGRNLATLAEGKPEILDLLLRFSR